MHFIPEGVVKISKQVVTACGRLPLKRKVGLGRVALNTLKFIVCADAGKLSRSFLGLANTRLFLVTILP